MSNTFALELRKTIFFHKYLQQRPLERLELALNNAIFFQFSQHVKFNARTPGTKTTTVQK